jgi:hypothetical protein
MLHLPPLRFYCVGGCWDRSQDSCDFGIGWQTLSSTSATSHPHSVPIASTFGYISSTLSYISYIPSYISSTLGYILSTSDTSHRHTAIHLIHTRLHLIRSRLHLIHTRLHLINTRLHLIHTRLHPLPPRLHLIHLGNISSHLVLFIKSTLSYSWHITYLWWLIPDVHLMLIALKCYQWTYPQPVSCF